MDRDLLLLKKQILKKSSIIIPTPADCKKIALLISRAVNRNISETTIKRLFGFAKATHNFSKYTLTALYEYIGETVFEPKDQLEDSVEKQIYALRTEAINLTLKTLNNIKNKSTIKYTYTARREFCEREFNYFYNKDYFFCSYVAQAGYGKSIMLANLVENFFLKEDASFSEDLVWFLNPHMLIDIENYEYSIDSWLDNHIRHIIPEGLIRFFEDNHIHIKRKVVFIIDGMDDVTLNKDSFNKLVNSLADFIFSNARLSWLKVVISMRNMGWLNLYEKIRHSAYIKSKWFSGNYNSKDEFTNIPPLTDKEIDSVISHFPIDVSNINPKTKIQLRTPFYLRFYYELLENGEDETYFTDLTYYELISKYVHLKVNLSAYYTEKIILLKKFIALTMNTQKGNVIEKTELLTEIVTFKDAYEELLLHGVLVEEKHYGGVLPVEIVRFQQAHVFEYFLFIETLDKHQGRVDDNYLKYIDKYYDNSPLALKLLQWTVRYVVKNNETESLIKLIEHDITVDEKKYFLFFIAELLESKEKGRQFANPKSDYDKIHNAFQAQLLGFDFTDFYYKNTLESLFKTAQSAKQKFLYQSLLGYVYFFELKVDKLKMAINQLEELGDKESVFQIKQQEAFELMLDHLMGNENIEKIISFINSKEILDNVPFGKLEIESVLSYFCYSMVSILYGRNEAFVKASEKIYTKHPGIFKGRSGLSLYLLIMSAFVHLNDDLDLVQRITRHITLVKNKIGDNFHSFFYLMLCFLMTLQNLSKANLPKALVYLEEGLSIAELKKVHYFEKLFLLISVNIYNHVGNFEKSEQNSYTLHCLVDDKKISTKNALKFLRGIGAKAPDLFVK